MGGPPEGEVAVVGPLEVEVIGIGKPGRIPVGGSHHRDHSLLPADRDTTELDIVGSKASSVLAWALVAQQLLNGGRDEIRVGAKAVGRLRMTKEGEEAVADEVAGGFLTSHHDDDEVRHDFFLRQPVAVDLSGGECVGKTRARLALLPVDRLPEICRHRLEARKDPIDAAWVVLEVAQHLGEVLRPHLQLTVIRGGYPQHLGHHDRRQRVGEVRHDVHLTTRSDRPEHRVGDLGDVGPHELDALRREGHRGEPAGALMSRGVEKEHLLDHHLRDRRKMSQPQRRDFVGMVRPVGRVGLQHCCYVVVAGDDERMQIRVPLDRPLAAQLAVQGVRIGENLWLQQAQQAERCNAGRRHRIDARRQAWREIRLRCCSASSSLIASISASTRRSISSASSLIEGPSNTARRGSSTPT